MEAPSSRSSGFGSSAGGGAGGGSEDDDEVEEEEDAPDNVDEATGTEFTTSLSDTPGKGTSGGCEPALSTSWFGSGQGPAAITEESTGQAVQTVASVPLLPECDDTPEANAHECALMRSPLVEPCEGTLDVGGPTRSIR